MADPQSAGGAASPSQSTSASLAVLPSSPSVSDPPGLPATCTTTLTVYPCPTTTSSPGARASVAGSPPDAASSQSSSTSAGTSPTSVASTSASSSSAQPSSPSSSLSQNETATISSSLASSDELVSVSTATADVSAAVPLAVTTSSSSDPTPFIGASPLDSSSDAVADLQTTQGGSLNTAAPTPASGDGSGAIATSASLDASPTPTLTPTLLGTIPAPISVGSSSPVVAFPSPSSSTGIANNTNPNTGSMKTSGAHAQSDASRRAIIAGAAVGGTVGALLLVVLLILFLRRRNQRARAAASRPLQRYLSTQGSVLGYGPDPFDRSTGIESVRTVADAFRGPGMIQHVSPAPSVQSARSIIQKMSRPPELPHVDLLGIGLGETTPRSWTTFQQQPSPLRNSTATDPDPGLLGSFSPTTSEMPYQLLAAPVVLSGSTPGPPNLISNRSSKASSSMYSYSGRSLADPVDPFRDSVVMGGGTVPGNAGQRRSFGDSVDPFRDAAEAPDPHSGLYSPPGRAL